MRHLILLGFVFLLSPLASLHAQDWTLEDVTVYDTFDAFEHVLHQNNDTTYVINFWATWCGPCVKELPYFEKVNQQLKGKPFKMILVSLDMKRKLEDKVIPFLNNQKIASEVILMDDGKPNNWIDKVDPSWSGAIPITVVRSGDAYDFYEKEFHSEAELMEIIIPYLNY